jgi:hypothetical protein
LRGKVGFTAKIALCKTFGTLQQSIPNSGFLHNIRNTTIANLSVIPPETGALFSFGDCG